MSMTEIDAAKQIAGEDLLNPLYEQVVKDYEEAKAWLSRCEAKLVQAVKLTDTDRLRDMTRDDPQSYGSSVLDILTNIRRKQAQQGGF